MASPRYIIALTGGIGSGKSTVAELFVQCAVHIIDTDVVAHTLTAKGGRALPALVKEFGSVALDADGALDRPRMRALVFQDREAKAKLEAILHPIIRAEVDVALASADAMRAPYSMLAVPLLFETMGYRGRTNRTLAVDCPVDLQRRRVQTRSALPAGEVDRILNSQLDRPLRLQLADDVISNSGEVSALQLQVANLHERYMQLAKSHP